jgi:Zn-dependent protease with chaperone function
MATAAPPLICPQGHGPGQTGTRFCTWCGAGLVASPTAGESALTNEPSLETAPTNGQWLSAAQAATPVIARASSGSSLSAEWQPVRTVPTPPVTSLPAASPAVPAPPEISTSIATPPAPLFTGSTPAAIQLQPVTAPTAATPILSPSPPAAPSKSSCTLCGGNGAKLGIDDVVCAQCGWLRPLFPGYQLDRSVFLWAQDGQAMMKLQKIPALHAVVRNVSDKVGRPWIESTFNGIRLGPRQLPDVWRQGVLAARCLGLTAMPDIYVSGDQQWNTYTFGSDTSAFIILGTAILNNFQNDEMLFVLAREMGHCRAGHALWKTVTRFLAGDMGPQSGLLSHGLLSAISPTKLIEGAVEMPLMAWSRQSEITADRAGLFAVGDEALARRVLLAWSIRSNRLLKQVNIDEWMKQEDSSDDQMTRFTEMTTSSSMYTSRRLRLLGQSAHEAEFVRVSQSIQAARKAAAPPPHPAPHAASAHPQAIYSPALDSSASPQPAGPAIASSPTQTGAPTNTPQASSPAAGVRVTCHKCQTSVTVPFAVLRGKTSLNVRCPQCRNVYTIRPRPNAQPAPAAPANSAPAAKTNSAPPPTASASPVKPAAVAPAKSVPASASPATTSKATAAIKASNAAPAKNSPQT